MLTCISPLSGTLKWFLFLNWRMLFCYLLSLETSPEALKSNAKLLVTMDALRSAAAVVSFAVKFQDTLDLIPIFHSAHNQKRLSFDGRDTYLRISDLRLEQNSRMTQAALLRMPEDAQAIADMRGRLHPLFGYQAVIADFSNKLPAQMEGSVRMYLEQGLGQGVFKDYFRTDASETNYYTPNPPHTRGYSGLSLQWRTKEPNKWFHAPSFVTIREDSPALVITVKKVSTLEHSGSRLICRQFLAAYF